MIKGCWVSSFLLALTKKIFKYSTLSRMPDKLITANNFKLLQLVSLIFTIFKFTILNQFYREFSHVFSLKGCAQPSSAWKKRKGAASFLQVLLITLLLVSLSTVVSATPSVSTDKSEYVLEEKVMISIANASSDAVMKIIVGENIYRFIGELNHSMEFLPSSTGEHIVSLEYDNSEAITSFMVNPLPEFPLEQSLIQRIYGPSDVLTGAETGSSSEAGSNAESAPSFQAPITPGDSEEIIISKDWLVIKNHEQETVDKSLAVYDMKNNRKYLSEENATARPIGQYDTEITLDNHPIRSILFMNLEVPFYSSLELRIDDLTGSPEKAGGGSKQFYVIDPTSLNFTQAYVTVTAKGEVLRKCKEWSYAEQRCYGTWEYVMSITPGQEYTFILTPEDPAYSESQRDADNCYNEYAARACTSAEVAAINTSGGTSYSFNRNAGQPIRISFADEPANISEVVNCTVFVKGYDNEGNTWTLQLGNWSTSTWDNAGTGQRSPSPEGTISWNCTPHFITRPNDDSLFDDFAVRISTNDRSTPATAYIDYVYVRINFSIMDQTPPYYSNIVVNRSSPATFSPNATYQFNTTWQDNEGVNTTWIEHNFTATFQNITITTKTGNVYYYNYGNLGAGTYLWRMYANDSARNLNNTMPWQTYTVNPANSQINLLLNGTSNNFTINNSGNANITGQRLAGEGNLTIYENSTQIAQGPSPLTSIRSYSTGGRYNITLVYPATQNYTESRTTLFITIQDTIPPGPVTNLRATSNGTSWIFWNWTNPSDTDFHHVEVWLNGTFQFNTTSNYTNITGLLADRWYEIEIMAVDNWVPPNKANFVNSTARTKPSADATPPAITNVQNTSITDNSAIISWTTDEASTSIVKYGTSPGVYTYTETNLTLTLSHGTTLSGLSSGTPYYYVVNSSDSAGNSNQSQEYNFTTLGDQSPPYYSNIAAAPASPATYSPTGAYQFNTTWQDNQAVNTTWIEHNFTGTMQNITVTTKTGNTYYYNYGSLGTGTYIWRTYANDTAHNLNNTMPWQTYTVSKATGQVNLLINSTDNDYSANESQSINITGILVAGEMNISLYENGTILSQGPSPQTYIKTYSEPGLYNLTLSYAETQNYTSNYETHFLTINDTRAPWIELIDPPNGDTDTDGDVILRFSVNDTSAVRNCSLYLNNTYNQEKQIFTKGENTFTVNSLGNGNYTWYVNCSDYANHYNISTSWNFTVHISEYFPRLTPQTCSDDSGGCTASNMNNTPGTWEEHGTLEKGTGQSNYVYINFSQPSIRAGSTIHWMYIYYDKYQTTTSGFLRLEWLNGSSWVTICSTNFGSSTAYAHDSVNCSFTSANTPNLTQINNGMQLRAEFYYSGNPSGVTYGTDEAYINLKYTEDVTPPIVELIGPNTYHRPGRVNFTYIPSDANLVSCTLYGDFSGSWLPNLSDTTVQSDQIENFTINLSEGYYTWNARCCDIADNCAFDELGGVNNRGNYTVNITNPDLIISQIAFNITSAYAKEGVNITINATIKNQGNVNVTETFTIQFYLGDPDAGGTKINDDKTISELNVNEEKTVNITWIIDQGGPRNIYVIVDPPLATGGSVKETLEDNNKNNNTIHVPAYNYFYGQVQNSFYLANAQNISFYYYPNISNVTGNILIADEESVVSFSDLQAIGRDAVNNPVPNDFNDTDRALNMTNYSDSIRQLYTANTDTPKATKTFTIFSQAISNVPIINSTNTSNFVIGILWDKSDGGTQYTGAQDLVFITEINMEKQGAYGAYDYEIRVPVNLRKYIPPNGNVIFYTEIISSAVS